MSSGLRIYAPFVNRILKKKFTIFLQKEAIALFRKLKVGEYRIDMVVEGHNDTRLAIECDGDRYHGADRWEADIHRQRILERVGWQLGVVLRPLL